MHLIALGMAKVTYGALRILRRHLGDDLDLGLVSFAVVMRTRRDLFHLVEQNGLNEETIAEISSERGFYTSINEISQYTKINRATVRRKMKKLEDLGILEKIDDDKWHLKYFEDSKDVRPAIMLRELLQNYLAITNTLEALLPDEIVPMMQQTLADLGPLEAKALLEEDVISKSKRGLEVKHLDHSEKIWQVRQA
ncbi:MAG: HTH domain-containing protein [Roseovarius gahaiensis]